MSQKTNLPANQLSAVFVCRRMVRSLSSQEWAGRVSYGDCRTPRGSDATLTLATAGWGRGQEAEAAGEREHELQHHPEPAQPDPGARRALPHLHQEEQERPQGCAARLRARLHLVARGCEAALWVLRLEASSWPDEALTLQLAHSRPLFHRRRGRQEEERRRRGRRRQCGRRRSTVAAGQGPPGRSAQCAPGPASDHSHSCSGPRGGAAGARAPQRGAGKGASRLSAVTLRGPRSCQGHSVLTVALCLFRSLAPARRTSGLAPRCSPNPWWQRPS